MSAERGDQERVLPGGIECDGDEEYLKCHGNVNALHATSLCSPVTWKVGNYSPNDFYQKIMLIGPNDYAEFSFEEMKEIYYYKGMNHWPLITDKLCRKKSGTIRHFLPPWCWFLLYIAFLPDNGVERKQRKLAWP